jgi:hypothetical protein
LFGFRASPTSTFLTRGWTQTQYQHPNKSKKKIKKKSNKTKRICRIYRRIQKRPALEQQGGSANGSSGSSVSGSAGGAAGGHAPVPDSRAPRDPQPAAVARDDAAIAAARRRFLARAAARPEGWPVQTAWRGGIFFLSCVCRVASDLNQSFGTASPSLKDEKYKINK